MAFTNQFVPFRAYYEICTISLRVTSFESMLWQWDRDSKQFHFQQHLCCELKSCMQRERGLATSQKPEPSNLSSHASVVWPWSKISQYTEDQTKGLTYTHTRPLNPSHIFLSQSHNWQSWSTCALLEWQSFLQLTLPPLLICLQSKGDSSVTPTW